MRGYSLVVFYALLSAVHDSRSIWNWYGSRCTFCSKAPVSTIFGVWSTIIPVEAKEISSPAERQGLFLTVYVNGPALGIYVQLANG